MSLIAPCGLDCAKCDGYIATQSGDIKKVEAVAASWSKMYNADVKAEHVWCDGCLVDGRKSYHCSTLCEIKKCVGKNKFTTCIECQDFACKLLDPIIKHVPEAKTNLEGLRK
jgi:hypothetical protein